MISLRSCDLRRRRATKKRLGCVVLLLLAAAPGLHASAPEWLRAAARVPLVSYPADTRAVVLLEEHNSTVKENGETIVVYRRAVKILRKEGRDEAEFGASFDNEARLKSIHAWSIAPGGKESEVKDKDFVETSPYSGELYSDERFKLARVPGAEPGAVVGFEYERRERPYLLDINWHFQESIPVRESRYILQLPPGWEFKSFWLHYKAVLPSSDGGNRWTWQLRDIPAIELEPSMQHWNAVAGRMAVAYFGSSQVTSLKSWPEISHWYFNLSRSSRETTPEISQKARDLAVGKKSLVEIVEVLGGFVQRNVRYVAIEIGIGGYQPHPAASIFRNRYGDCKDKVTLLGTMLHDAGVESNYFLVHTSRGVVDPEAPSSYFNHVITAVELPPALDAHSLQSVVKARDGRRYLLFDPTDAYTQPGEIPVSLQDSYGLLVRDQGGELLHLPLLRPESNELRRTAKLKLQPDGTLSGEVREARSGEEASIGRQRFSSSDKDGSELNKWLDQVLKHSLSGFTVEKSSIENLSALDKDLIIQYNFSAQKYAKSAGNLLILRPRVMGAKSEDLGIKPRKYPLEFSAASHQSDVFDIELPPGYSVDELPDPVKLDVGFAQYSSKTEMRGSVLRYSRDYTIRQVVVPVDHMADLKKLMAGINVDERNSVLLKRSTCHSEDPRLHRGAEEPLPSDKFQMTLWFGVSR